LTPAFLAQSFAPHDFTDTERRHSGGTWELVVMQQPEGQRPFTTPGAWQMGTTG